MGSTLQELTHQGIRVLGKTIQGRIQPSTETPIHLSYTVQSAPNNILNKIRKSITGNPATQSIKLESNEQISENKPYTRLFNEWRNPRDAYGDSTQLQTKAFNIFLDGIHSKSGFANTYIQPTNNHTQEDREHAKALFEILELDQQPTQTSFKPEIVYFPRRKQLRTALELVRKKIPFDMNIHKEEIGPLRIEEYHFQNINDNYQIKKVAQISQPSPFRLSTKDFKEAENFIQHLHPNYRDPTNWKLHVYEKPLAKNAVD